MNKIIILLTAFCILFSVTAYAADISVVIDGNTIEFDVPPQTIDDRTMVPMRKIFETFGAKVDWVEESQIILATYKETFIMLQIDKNVMVIQKFSTNENRQVELDVPPQVINERTLVPVRAISEALGANVEWNDDTQTVTITRD